MAAACHNTSAGTTLQRVGLANDAVPRGTIEAKRDTRDGEREPMPLPSRPKQGVIDAFISLLDI